MLVHSEYFLALGLYYSFYYTRNRWGASSKIVDELDLPDKKRFGGNPLDFSSALYKLITYYELDIDLKEKLWADCEDVYEYLDQYTIEELAPHILEFTSVTLNEEGEYWGNDKAPRTGIRIMLGKIFPGKKPVAERDMIMKLFKKADFNPERIILEGEYIVNESFSEKESGDIFKM